MDEWTIERVLEYFSFPTHYENERKITIEVSWRLLEAHEEIQFYERLLSDGTKTILILLKHPQGWYGLIPTKEQYKVLTANFRILYETNEYYNNMVRTEKARVDDKLERALGHKA